MTQTEHLERIKSHCLANLALAEKRTPGMAMFSTVNPNAAQPQHYVHFGAAHVADVIGEDNAVFIAACAGAAEAGWRATIAAIEGLQPMLIAGHRCDSTVCDTCNAANAIAAILVAWPEDSL